MLIGIDRDMNDKPVGMRTLALVALGSALVSISVIEFQNLRDHPDAISRVIQGVVAGVLTGVGFIGAGVILHDAKAKTVHGLTTAATVWIAAGLGIACALGAWLLVGAAIAVTAAGAIRARLGRATARIEIAGIPNDTEEVGVRRQYPRRI
ncbi:MgtC/SapB family protein [Bradyrhizobium symbiodeficiens]|uniref:Protein MgtC n=1 Tax=Bradyrhizobium symbiodeficiens TaxID=1404367 RepID=A0ABZ2F100_9BRAD|nr:MgtC/SapB family protein [Bradyrhizobium symbiodeficiens]